jgi:hypothetical protein
MREQMVVCGGLQAPRGSPIDTLKLDVNASAGSPHKVNLHLGDLSRPMADNIPDVLTDMLEIAAYVYCADQFTKRGTKKTHDEHGCRLAPQVPVQDSCPVPRRVGQGQRS